MRVKCPYCNGFFDLDENFKCPVCGGDVNKEDIDEYKKLQKEKESINLKQKELDLQKKKHNFQIQLKQEKIRKNFTTTYIIVVLMFVFGLPLISHLLDVAENTLDTFQEVMEEQNKPVDVPITVSFNEKAETVNYSIICDKVENWVYDKDDFTKSIALPKPGEKHVRFHFVLENTSNEKLYNYKDNDFVFSVDDFQCSEVLYLTPEASAHFWKKSLDLAPGLKKEGYIYMIVPQDATEVKIVYNGLVTINVPLP